MICFFINDVKLSTVKYILDSSDEIFEKTKKDFKSLDFQKYEIFKGYEDIDDNKNLKAFKYDFQKWVDEIKNVYLEDNFNYLDVYKYNKISFFVDGRMTAEALRILCVDTQNSDICKYYSTTLFKPEEAHVGRCTAKSTIYCANIAAGFLVSNFTKWLRDIRLEKDILINLLTNEINTYEESSND